jgi:hypothetical protein
MSSARVIGLLVLALLGGAMLGSLIGGVGLGALAGLTALALLVSVFLPVRRPPVAHVVPERGPPRRRPMAPPPTRGRWDEAPR